MPSPAIPKTFLFCDVAGSARGWEAHGAAYGAAIRRHFDILDAVVRAHGGRVFKTVGDEVCAVFPSPGAGLLAAIEGQRALLAEPWPDAVGPVRVRMGLHCGQPVERGGDYFGPPVNRAARLMDAAHPNQILLSGAVRAGLPGGLDTRPLGVHFLRNLSEPESIFQAVADGLPSDFPPPRTMDARPHNLPAQLTSFVGRTSEMEDLAARFDDASTRLVTLIGPPGVGKTRLATQFASEYAFRYPDGVWLVELAAVRDPAAVPFQIESALGVARDERRPVAERLFDALAQRRLLLVCDNFEHLLPAAETISGLLRATKGVQVLVTSRSLLRVAGETAVEVAPLPAPEPRPDLTLGDLVAEPATALFLDRAAAARPGWTPSDAEAPELADLCRQLDGLPLAIELAAARLRSMSLRDIRARLSDRFRLLSAGAGDLPERQRTLRAALDWSFGLLRPDEQITLSQLGVFRGGFVLDAAEAVCSAGDVWTLVPALHNQSFLVVREREGEMRYHMLEAVREYACERLGARAAPARRAHARYFLGLAERCAAALDTADDARATLALEADADNVRAAMANACAEADVETCARITAAVAEFFNRWGWWAERLQCIERALASARLALPHSPVTAWLLYHHANALADLGRLGEAGFAAHDALRCSRELRDEKLEAWSENLCGFVAERSGDKEAAETFYANTIALARRNGDAFSEALALTNRGRLHDAAGRDADAVADLQRSLPLWESVGSARGLATTLTNLGCIADEVIGARAEGGGDLAAAHASRAEAIRMFRHALALQLELMNQPKIGLLLNNIGEALERDGHPDDAVIHYDAAEALFRRVGSPNAAYVARQRERALASTTHPPKRLDHQDPMAFAREVAAGGIGVPRP
ncbi:MAG TPA: AAA family ATPase [Armatimonadota bacterium]|jgi:predicted ATPase/class 3 adenylate cyclase